MIELFSLLTQEDVNQESSVDQVPEPEDKRVTDDLFSFLQNKYKNILA
jgi:hypothetical protein